ncbi:tumor protein p53-inducible nuclear protein 1-like [Rhopilema esculentum]|uniref:tumor protein p53-inducible nuclear protein 1-like n=1 Tax=Rhopilema esculentum TaxID=499914 RepID=UPI0031DA37F0
MATNMEESWLVTPPSCFSGKSKKQGKDSSDSLENLLIEHPSMSVYGPRSADKGPSPEQPADGSSVVAKQNGAARHVAQGKVFLCQSQKDRGPLKSLGCNYGNSLAYTKSRKGSKRSNHTHQRALHGRHYKKLNRKDGKHVGMVGKRAA